MSLFAGSYYFVFELADADNIFEDKNKCFDMNFLGRYLQPINLNLC